MCKYCDEWLRSQGLSVAWPMELVEKALEATRELQARLQLYEQEVTSLYEDWFGELGMDTGSTMPPSSRGTLRSYTPEDEVPMFILQPTLKPRLGAAAPPTLDSDASRETPCDLPGGGLARFLARGTFSDLTILYDNQETRVHKIVLCSQSRWFARTLEATPSPAVLDLLSNTWLWAFEALLSFLYHGSYEPIYAAYVAKTATFVIGPPEWHAHVYLHALVYEVPNLQIRAIARFRAACANILTNVRHSARAGVQGAGEVDLGPILRAVQTVYERTEGIEGAGGAKDGLRKAVIEVVKENFVSLTRYVGFRELVAEVEGLRRELEQAFAEDGLDLMLVRGGGGLRFH